MKPYFYILWTLLDQISSTKCFIWWTGPLWNKTNSTDLRTKWPVGRSVLDRIPNFLFESNRTFFLYLKNWKPCLIRVSGSTLLRPCNWAGHGGLKELSINCFATDLKHKNDFYKLKWNFYQTMFEKNTQRENQMTMSIKITLIIVFCNSFCHEEVFQSSKNTMTVLVLRPGESPMLTSRPGVFSWW